MMLRWKTLVKVRSLVSKYFAMIGPAITVCTCGPKKCRHQSLYRRQPHCVANRSGADRPSIDCYIGPRLNRIRRFAKLLRLSRQALWLLSSEPAKASNGHPSPQLNLYTSNTRKAKMEHPHRRCLSRPKAPSRGSWMQAGHHPLKLRTAHPDLRSDRHRGHHRPGLR